MNNSRWNQLKCLSMAAGLLLGAGLHGVADANPLFENNFEKMEINKVPDGFLVLDGGFAVKEESGNKFLELPGAPLDTFGVLFGPTQGSDVAVSARVFGTGKGRQFPSFGVGLNGAGGYRLVVSPAKKALELFKGDESVATGSFDWESGSWTMLKLQVRKSGDTWKIEGKAWKEKSEEPKAWLISHEEKEKPSDGRAAVWGNPFSGTPIRFDDLLVMPVSEK